MLDILIEGIPRSKKNSKIMIFTRGKPMLISSKQFLEWHESAMWQLKKYPQLKIDYPVNLECHFFMPNKRRCDLSNLYEGVQDALVEAEILEDDNYTIIASHDGSDVSVDRENPRIEIKIRAIN